MTILYISVKKTRFPTFCSTYFSYVLVPDVSSFLALTLGHKRPGQQRLPTTIYCPSTAPMTAMPNPSARRRQPPPLAQLGESSCPAWPIPPPPPRRPLPLHSLATTRRPLPVEPGVSAKCSPATAPTHSIVRRPPPTTAWRQHPAQQCNTRVFMWAFSEVKNSHALAWADCHNSPKCAFDAVAICVCAASRFMASINTISPQKLYSYSISGSLRRKKIFLIKRTSRV